MTSARHLFTLAPSHSLLLALALTGTAQAARVDHIAATVDRPVAIRGGVLMLPLTAQRHGTHWPASLNLILADGRSLENQVIWMDPAPLKLERLWTDASYRVNARAITDADDSSRSPNAVLLLARLPADGAGPIELHGQKLRPLWMDLPGIAVGSEPIPPAADGRAALVQPDLESPFEHWRSVLIAQSANAAPPPLARFDPVHALMAEHFSGLWMCGLARLEKAASELAVRCRRTLVQTARDGDLPIATWFMHSAELNELRTVLLDDRRDDRAMGAAVGAWLDAIDPLLVWPEGDDGDRVRVAILNRGLEDLVVRYRWNRAGEEPLAAEAPAGRVAHVVIDRPPPPPQTLANLPRPRDEEVFTLNLFTGSRQLDSLLFGPRVRAAGPPGVAVGPFMPPMALVDLDNGYPRPMPLEFATFANLRRIGGRWEIFFECRRPLSEAGVPGSVAIGDPLGQIRSFNDSRGVEAVTLLLGPVQATSTILTIPEQGMWRLLAGTPSSALQVHRRSYDDRWYGRVVLPESWLPPTGIPLHMGFARTHSGSQAAEWGPGLSVPWSAEPQRAVVSLDEWSDLP